MKMTRVTCSIFCRVFIAGSFFAIPAAAQTRDGLDSNGGPSQVGRTVSVGNGRVGERQTAEEVAPNAKPLSRLQGRVANRIENRISNRIDRNYDAQSNETSSFRTAGERVRTAGRPEPH